MTSIVEVIPAQLVEDYKGAAKPRLIINPANLYPAMIDHIREVLQSVETSEDGELLTPVLPELAVNKLDNKGAENLIEWAYSITDEAWQDALTPRSEFADGDPRLELRAQALDCALGWYTRVLRMECRRKGLPVPDRTITRDDDYRL